MKSSSNTPASTDLPPTGLRQLQWLLFSLLVCGFLLLLPSQASTPHSIESGRADQLFADAPFIAATNELLRAVRTDDSEQRGNTAGDAPLAGLPADIFQVPVLPGSINVSVAFVLPPLPVNSLPGAPRGPPVVSR